MISPLIAPVRLTFNPTFTGIALLGSIGFILPEGVSTTQLFVVIFSIGLDNGLLVLILLEYQACCPYQYILFFRS